MRALARRPINGIETIAAGLINLEAIAAAIGAANDATHLYYAALNPGANLSVEAERNGQMLGNLLDGLDAVGRHSALEMVTWQLPSPRGLHPTGPKS